MLSGEAFSGVDPEMRRATPEYYALDVSLLGIEQPSRRRLRIISAGNAEKDEGVGSSKMLPAEETKRRA